MILILVFAFQRIRFFVAKQPHTNVVCISAPFLTLFVGVIVPRIDVRSHSVVLVFARNFGYNRENSRIGSEILARRTEEERLVDLEEKIRKMQLEKQRLANQVRQKERKERTRRLIQVG